MDGWREWEMCADETEGCSLRELQNGSRRRRMADWRELVIGKWREGHMERNQSGKSQKIKHSTDVALQFCSMGQYRKHNRKTGFYFHHCPLIILHCGNVWNPQLHFTRHCTNLEQKDSPYPEELSISQETTDGYHRRGEHMVTVK